MFDVTKFQQGIPKQRLTRCGPIVNPSHIFFARSKLAKCTSSTSEHGHCESNCHKKIELVAPFPSDQINIVFKNAGITHINDFSQSFYIQLRIYFIYVYKLF